MKKTELVPPYAVLKQIMRIMKLTAFFVFLLSMQLYATSFGQTAKISLSMNSSLKDVIEQIETVSGYHFVLKADQKILDKVVSVNYSDQNIEEILEDLFRDTGYTYKIIDRYIAVTEVGKADQIQLQQQEKVSGKVTDETGAPLPGVTVVVKGTTNGTITDFDGNYSLGNVGNSDVLVFSFVGMQSQEIVVAGASVVNAVLKEETIGLAEVVAVGYQIQRKADLTGAIEVIELQSIENVSLSSGNPMQALQGRVPGLYIEKNGSPNATNSRILIRGVNTLGDNNPLYIIDGVPTKRPEVFQGLSAGSIVSVQVLKDASASSIYGARASNGVVIVTTKNGSEKKGKVKVEFNSNFSMQSEKSQRFKMLNAVDRGRALWQASVNDGVDPASGYGEIYDFDWNGDYNNPVLNSVTPQPYVGGDTNVPVGDTDWQDVTYETGYVISNDLTVSGGTDKSSVLMNVGYIKNTGMLKYTNYDRITARINGQTSLLDDKLKFGINAQVVSSNETLETPDLGSAPTPGLAITLAPTIPLYTKTGEYGGPLGSGYSDRNNPVMMQYINRWDNTNRKYLFGSVFAEAKPVKNLVLRTTLGLDYSMVEDKDIEPAFTNGFIARSVNSLTIYNSDFTSVTWSNTAHYDLELGKSKFGFLLGVESVSDNFKDFTGYKEGFSTQTEEFFVLSAGTSNGNSFGTATGSRLLSQFGKIDYNYDQRFLASFTLRRDGSSRFGKDNRYGFFPAATFGWRLSEEEFMKGMENLTNLKFRAGVGRVGNQDVGDFASLGLFEPRYGAVASQVDGVFHNDFFDDYWNIGSAYALNGQDTGNLPSGFVSVQAANPALRWETTDELNLGLDFGFFDSKLVGSFDWYTRKTTDILIQPPVASALGEGQLQFLNGATKKNSGWEFALSYRKEVNKDFTYEVAGSASHFADKITELPEEVRTAYPGNSEQTVVGHSELSIFGYVADGIFKSQAEVDDHANQVGAAPGRIRWADLNNDGEINSLDQKFLGTLLPKLEYSLRVDLNYKNFDLSIFGSGVAGKTGYDPYTFYNDFIRGRDNVGPGVFRAWTPQNPDSSVPGLTLSDSNNETRTSSYLNVNASYFKLRNVQLGYTLPNNTLERIGMDKLRFYVMAENLFWIKSKEFQGPDPERTDVNVIPIPRTFSVGVNVAF
ncbi:SusC/RagA family TonB-linked outer membrane protein [Mangrovibacterium diazotrophicum]|uniref:TonB-linked SusC/RagA family outer membrane protein n=1 Tax=Mangrovibacterium diazotrophicum TaxID=1261403 RepID=A0A419W5J4_9BACT|nr:SusC/RagA family TonB-linked outer membrane protein [Mangrovibacterium diazotrophicum]RKD90741.1 TonB-linked SusC/RagA family outer membrane protein [Mangrovibacterium diazotrophicum]